MEKRYEFKNKMEKTVTQYFLPKGINYAKIKKTVGGVYKMYHVFNTHFEVSNNCNNK